jgi:hypothetical protein
MSRRNPDLYSKYGIDPDDVLSYEQDFLFCAISTRAGS